MPAEWCEPSAWLCSCTGLRGCANPALGPPALDVKAALLPETEVPGSPICPWLGG